MYSDVEMDDGPNETPGLKRCTSVLKRCLSVQGFNVFFPEVLDELQIKVCVRVWFFLIEFQHYST